MYNIEDQTLKGAPWSISKAGVIEKCSLQFDYKYGPNKIQETSEISIQTTIGKAVHAALEMALAGADISKAYLIASDRLELDTQTIEQMSMTQDWVTKFVKWVGQFKTNQGVTKTFIEQQWAVDAELNSTHYYNKQGLMRGVIDLALITSKKDLVVIDHKNGKENDLNYYDTQLKTYCVLGLAQFPQLRGVQTAINFTSSDKMVWNKFVSADTIRNEYMPWMVDYLNKVSKPLLDSPKGVKGWYCDWCGYKKLCPLFNKDVLNGPEENS